MQDKNIAYSAGAHIRKTTVTETKMDVFFPPNINAFIVKKKNDNDNNNNKVKGKNKGESFLKG